MFWSTISYHLSDEPIGLSVLSMACISLSIFAAGWGPMTSEALMLDGRARAFAAVSITRDICGACVVIASLYIWTLGIQSIFLGLAAVAAIDVMLGLRVIHPFLAFRLNSDAVRMVLSEVHLSVVQIFDAGGKALERAVISHKLGFSTLGIVGHSLSYETIAIAGVKSISRSIWPENLREAEQPRSGFPIAKIATGIIASICLRAAICAATIGYDIIGLLTHDKLNGAAYFAAAWILNVSISTTGFAAKAALYVDGKSKLMSTSIVFTRLSSILLLIALIDQIDAAALIVGALVSAVVAKIIIYRGISKYRPIPFQDGIVILQVGVGYLALATSYFYGDTYHDRTLMMMGWMAEALILSVATLKTVGLSFTRFRKLFIQG